MCKGYSLGGTQSWQIVFLYESICICSTFRKGGNGKRKNREEGVFGPAVGDDKRKIVEAEQSVVVVKLLKVK